MPSGVLSGNEVRCAGGITMEGKEKKWLGHTADQRQNRE